VPAQSPRQVGVSVVPVPWQRPQTMMATFQTWLPPRQGHDQQPDAMDSIAEAGARRYTLQSAKSG
jgi:hypothetical protein